MGQLPPTPEPPDSHETVALVPSELTVTWRLITSLGVVSSGVGVALADGSGVLVIVGVAVGNGVGVAVKVVSAVVAVKSRTAASSASL